MLLYLGAKIDARDEHHYASKNDNLDSIVILMMFGADVEAVNIDNKRAIDLANSKETKYLLRKFKLPSTKKIVTVAANVLIYLGVLYHQLNPGAIERWWNQANLLLNGAHPLGINF